MRTLALTLICLSACQLDVARVKRPCASDADCAGDGKVCREERCVVASSYNSAPKLLSVSGDGTPLGDAERAQLAAQHGGTPAPAHFARALVLTGNFLQGGTVELVAKSSGARRELQATPGTGPRVVIAALPQDLAEGLYSLVVSTAYGQTSQEVTILRGEKGEKGDKGDQGIKGDPGDSAPTYTAGEGIIINTTTHAIAVDTDFFDDAVAAFVGPLDGGNPTNHPRYTDAEARAAMGALDGGNPLNHPRYTDAEAVAAMGALDGGNPLNHPRYNDTEAVAAMGTKDNANPLHHDRYADPDALAAMGNKSNSNPYHHDRYTNSEARAEARNVLGERGYSFLEAEDTGQTTGLVSATASDATASGGAARAVAGAASTAGLLWRRQLTGSNRYHVGPVVVSARVRASSASANAPFTLTCEGVRADSNAFSVTRSLLPADLGTTDWTTVSLLCDLRRDDASQTLSLATTADVPGGVTLALDYVTVVPATATRRCFAVNSATVSKNAGEFQEVDCPAGTIVTGGGCNLTATNKDLGASEPKLVSGSLVGWRCSPSEQTNTKAYAICCDPW